MEFIQRIAKQLGVSSDHPIVRYLERKTKAADRGSKARRSLGQLYVLHVLAKDFLDGQESRHSELMSRMKALPFGAKLQNHSLDNRLNSEFGRLTKVEGDLLPVQMGTKPGLNSRIMSIPLLSYQSSNPVAVASFVIEVVDAYVSLIDEKQTGALADVDDIKDLNGLRAFFESAFAAKSDARLFEVGSYVLLANYYSRKKIWIGDTEDSISESALMLFKTGRTNANDGGIDFVLKPVGRFFQVTETLDFKKYFLDLEKVNRFPISFVIKSELNPVDAITRIRADSIKSGKYSSATTETYMSLFEEVFTLPTLRTILELVPESSYASLKADLTLQFQLEYGILD